MQEVLAQPTDHTPFPMEQGFVTKPLVDNDKYEFYVICSYYSMTYLKNIYALAPL